MLSMEISIVTCEKQHARRRSDLCRARLVRPGRIRGAGFQPRHKPTRSSPTTACAASPAQSLPYDADPKRELAPKLPNSNRSWYRLEFNISPTKQRTGVLSNRSYKWRFLEPKQPAGRQLYIRQKQAAGSPPNNWRAFGMPAVRKARAKAGENLRRPPWRRTPLLWFNEERRRGAASRRSAGRSGGHRNPGAAGRRG
jgi:hypothetical protein